MTKTVLFVPGRGESLTSYPYTDVLETFDDLGYDSQFVPISWVDKRITADQVAAEVRAAYQEHNPDNIILAAHSLGGPAILQVAAENPPAAVWSFSLSPYFKEFLTPEFIAKFKDEYGPGELESYQQLSYVALANQVDCNIQLFVGSEDHPAMYDLHEDISNILPDNQLTIVPGVGHDMTDEMYLATMQAHLSTLTY